MSRKDGYTYPQVGIDEASEAWADVQKEAVDYGVSPGEFIRILVVSWSKLKRGQWNPLWGAQAPIYSSNGAPTQATRPDSEAERKQREEAERRKRIRLAAAQAEADELE